MVKEVIGSRSRNDVSERSGVKDNKTRNRFARDTVQNIKDRGFTAF